MHFRHKISPQRNEQKCNVFFIDNFIRFEVFHPQFKEEIKRCIANEFS